MNHRASVLPRLQLAAAFERFLRLLAEHHQVFVVGGWLRDALRGQPPHDADFATDADAESVSALAAQAGLRIFADKVAAHHGTYRMTSGRPGEVLDVATLRRDVARQGNRHAAIAFTDDIVQDLARRDLTINGMAAVFPLTRHATAGLIDPFGGQRDLALRRLRLIGAPRRRLEEDPLRLLRVARFAGMAGPFRIEAATRRALRARGSWLRRVSFERVRDELTKAMALPNAYRFWQVVHRAGVLPWLWPLAGTFCWRAGCRALRKNRLRPGTPLGNLTLFAIAGSVGARAGQPLALGEGVRQVLRRLRFAKDEVNAVAESVAAFPWRPAELSGEPLVAWMLQHGAPAIGACRDAASTISAIGLVPKAPLDALWRRIDRLLDGRPWPDLRHLAVDGHTLAEAGLAPAGPALGQLLRHLLHVGVATGCWTDREALLSLARTCRELPRR